MQTVTTQTPTGGIGQLSGIALECADPAAGYRPPVWPDPASSMQFHLHFRVDDLDAAQAVVLAAGGTLLAHQPSPGLSRVFADPAGHPFCLCPRRG